MGTTIKRAGAIAEPFPAVPGEMPGTWAPRKMGKYCKGIGIPENINTFSMILRRTARINRYAQPALASGVRVRQC